jgi:hypothetical protein
VDSGANALGGALGGNQDLNKQLNEGGAGVNPYGASQQQQDQSQIQQHMQNQ